MQKSNTTAIAGVIIFGILALGLTFYVLSERNASPPSPSTHSVAATSPAPVTPKVYYVATREILPRTMITRDMLMERESKGNPPIPDNAVTDPFQVVGKLANNIVEPGQMFTTSATVQPVTRVIPANIPVPTGLRAIAIWVNPQETAAGLVDVGDRVDVLVTTKLKGKTSTSDSTEFISGRTIAQDLQVLAVDRSIDSQGAGTSDSSPKPPATANTNQAPNADATHTRVIVAATPEQAQRIAAANENGTIHITIRNPGDSMVMRTGESLEYPVRLISSKTTSSTSVKTSNRPSQLPRYPQLQTGPAFPVPAAAAPAPFNQVTVIKGTTQTQTTVPN